MPQYHQDARADLIGPTVDSNAEQAVPLYRQEGFQIQAAKAPPIRIDGKPRPLTSRVSHQIEAKPAVVLNRVSNQNPANQGGDDVCSIWGVSDPWSQPGFALPGLGAVAGRSGNVLAIAAGLAVGIGVFYLAKRIG